MFYVALTRAEHQAYLTYAQSRYRWGKLVDSEPSRFIEEIKDEIKNLNNTVIIVDEAHNITGNEVYTSLMRVLSRSYNYRLILLTATPMYDNSTEIFELANLYPGIIFKNKSI